LEVVSRTSTAEHLPAGTRVGDYRIEDALGADDNGATYRATHAVLPRQAIVKVAPFEHGARGGGVQLLREACLLEALAHPGIPRVYECGILSDRQPWAAFELIRGVSLGDLAARAPIALADLVTLLRDVGGLLAHAHSRGVVHRRISEDSIMLATGRAVHVAVRHWSAALTFDTGAPVAVDAQDDVLALGAVARRALVGASPDGPDAARQPWPSAPAELTALIDEMLAPDPRARPPSDEVCDRAQWLADTLEARPALRARWTPPRGMAPEALAAAGGATDAAAEEVSSFAIRFGRPQR
jgi:hypothetical protein